MTAVDRYECPHCQYPGKYLAEVFSIIERNPFDPAKDRVRCRFCNKTCDRYDGLIKVGDESQS